ncbi:YgaP family membrane protein [Planctomycetaceae bacterium SH139]
MMNNTFDQATPPRSYQSATANVEITDHCSARTDQNISRGEQIASMAGGIGLALFGLAREKPWGWLWTAIGASLACRGYSGHCYTYQSLRIDTSEKTQGISQNAPASGSSKP